MQPVRHILVPDPSVLGELLEAVLNLTQLVAFRLDKGGNSLAGKKRRRATCAFCERLEALIGLASIRTLNVVRMAVVRKKMCTS